MKVIEKDGAGKHPAPLACPPVNADPLPSSAPRRSRWLTTAVLAVVAGFFVATLAALVPLTLLLLSATVRADDGPCCNTIQIDGDVSYVELHDLTIAGHGVAGARCLR